MVFGTRAAAAASGEEEKTIAAHLPRICGSWKIFKFIHGVKFK